MRGLLLTAIALVFQVVYIGLLRNAFSAVGVEASEVETAGVVKRSIWNDLVPRGTWHEIVSRQVSSGNRTKDMYDFFTPDEPPARCALDCELIWGAVSACDLRSCLCTEQYGHEFERCVRCLAPDPTALQTEYYQGILDEFQADYCRNYRVPPLSLTAGEATGGSSTTSQSTSSIPIATGGGDSGIGLASGALSQVPQAFTAMMLACVISVGLWWTY